MEYIPRVMYQLQRSGFKLSFCVLQLQHTTTRAAVWALTVALIGKQRAFMQCCWINVQAPRPLSPVSAGLCAQHWLFVNPGQCSRVLGGGWELLIALQRDHGALRWLLPAETGEMQAGEIQKERKALLWTDSAGGPHPLLNLWFPQLFGQPAPAQPGVLPQTDCA